MMTFLIAWRNLWRHPRRTIVILLAVVVGVWAMVFYAAFMRGMIEEMIRQNISNLAGHVQVQATGYFENPVIDHRIAEPGRVLATVRDAAPPGARWTARLRSGVVVRSAYGALGATLVGIIPEEEVGLSFIGADMVEQPTFASAPDGVIAGRALLERLEARVGHRIVVDAQDAHGRVVSRAFTIAGEFRTTLEATERQFLFCHRQTLQQALGVGDAVSEVSIVVARDEEADALAAALRERLPAKSLRALTWRELVPFVGAWLESMDLFTVIWNVIVFVAMSFGLVNAVLMAVFERIREFGLVRALGVTPFGIVREVLLETALLLAIGFSAGGAIAWASTEWLARTGIDLSAFAAGSEYFGMARILYPELQAIDFVRAGATVFILGLLVSLYPAVKAARITPVQAMAHV